jgi:hypothetical protein
MTVADHLKNQAQRLYEAFAAFPDETSQQLAKEMRAVRTPAALRAMALRMLIVIASAHASLRSTVAAHQERLRRDQAAAERQAAELRDARGLAEDFQAQSERVRGTAVELTQLHLPVAAFSEKTLAFAAAVPVPALNARVLHALCHEAQRKFFLTELAVATEIFEEQKAETELAWKRVVDSLGAELAPLPSPPFRPPVFSPVPYASTSDDYEKFRAIGLGGRVPSMLFPLFGIVAWLLGWVFAFPLMIVGAVAAYNSHKTMKAAQFRRELPALAGEQCRRIQAATVRQIHNFHDEAAAAARLQLR